MEISDRGGLNNLELMPSDDSAHLDDVYPLTALVA